MIADAEVPASDTQEPVRWTPRAWEKRLDDLDAIPTEFVETRGIPRAALLQWGRAPLDSPEERRGFFISIMAWGYGRARGGPWRTRQMLSTPDADDRICRAIDVLRTYGAVAGYRALAHGGGAHLKWLGPSFGTKLLYFAGYGSDVDPKPLILDRLVGAALDEFKVYLQYNGWDALDYEAYLNLARHVADQTGREPHDVEWWLFQRGRHR